MTDSDTSIMCLACRLLFLKKGLNFEGENGSHIKTVLYRPQGFKTFFMLNSTEHKISTAHKN